MHFGSLSIGPAASGGGHLSGLTGHHLKHELIMFKRFVCGRRGRSFSKSGDAERRCGSQEGSTGASGVHGGLGAPRVMLPVLEKRESSCWNNLPEDLRVPEKIQKPIVFIIILK